MDGRIMNDPLLHVLKKNGTLIWTRVEENVICLRIGNERSYLRDVKRIDVKPHLWGLVYDGVSSEYISLENSKVYELSKSVAKSASSEVIFMRRDVVTMPVGISWLNSRIYTEDGIKLGLPITMRFKIADPVAFLEFVVGDTKVFSTEDFCGVALPTISNCLADVFREYKVRSVINRLERHEIFSQVLSRLASDMALWGVELISFELNGEPAFPPEQWDIVERVKKTELERLLLEKERLEKLLSDWKERLEKLEKDYFDGKITREMYDERSIFAREKSREIENQLEKLNAALD